MEIHVTSLNTSALKLNPQNAGQQDTVQNQPENKRANSDKPLQHSATATQKPEEVEQLLVNAGLSDIGLLNADKTENPINTRLLNAVNAYTTTLNQPMQDQRAQLVAGIDFYV
ncbi:hypothetical protein [Methylotuvimicrobium sp.]|uniref:hypothetical protein n=1 Tax=Methylotuvimicrobium sp. TaxID=2822413 RepID=UPI003D65923E